VIRFSRIGFGDSAPATNLIQAAATPKNRPRKEFLYWSDDGDLVALRFKNWKLVFAEQRAHGFDVWQEPFVQLRVPKPFNLRSDSFERADTGGFQLYAVAGGTNFRWRRRKPSWRTGYLAVC
jgi:arylsulfatase A-like enzyme